MELCLMEFCGVVVILSQWIERGFIFIWRMGVFAKSIRDLGYGGSCYFRSGSSN